MNAKIVTFGSAVALAALVAALYWLPTGDAGPAAGSTRPSSSTGSILVYCAAGVRKPVEAAARAYEREHGVRVQLQYGGSQTLLTNAKLANTGDLYVPADDAYVELARNEGLIAETAALATMRPVLAVRRGNPKSIRSLADLARDDVRIGLADPKAAAIGKVVADALAAAGKWSPIERRVTVTKPTVNDVATDVHLGTIDAAFVWDATVRQMPGQLEAVADVPELRGRVSTVSGCVLKTAADPAAAGRFLRYLSSSDRGAPQFEAAGFTPAAGDRWSRP
jgi:molybdate transport system substrate-binding protein